MDKKNYRGFRDLIVYQKSYRLAIEITKLTKTFPKEEKYVLVDQMRRVSRSIPANLAEAWARRRYPKSFISKLIDSHGEEMEMEVWLDMAFEFEYITKQTHYTLLSGYLEIRKYYKGWKRLPKNFATKIPNTSKH